MSRHFVHALAIERVCLQALGGQFALASPPFHLALPYGRFSPTRQGFRFAPVLLFAVSYTNRLRLTSSLHYVRHIP